jgi:hypothetical protein
MQYSLLEIEDGRGLRANPTHRHVSASPGVRLNMNAVEMTERFQRRCARK